LQRPHQRDLRRNSRDADSRLLPRKGNLSFILPFSLSLSLHYLLIMARTFLRAGRETAGGRETDFSLRLISRFSLDFRLIRRRARDSAAIPRRNGEIRASRKLIRGSRITREVAGDQSRVVVSFSRDEIANDNEED